MSSRAIHSFGIGIIVAALAAGGAPAQEALDFETRFHDVGDLVSRAPHAPVATAPFAPLLFSTDRGLGGERLGVDDGLDPFNGSGESGSITEEDVHGLFALLAGNLGVVAEDGGGLGISGGRLSLQGPAAAQAALERWLLYVRSRAPSSVRIECVILPAAQLDAALSAAERAGGRVSAAAFAALPARPGARLVVLSATIGRRVASGGGDRHLMLGDYEVNQTGVIPVARPVIQRVDGGDRIEALVRRVPGSARLTLDLACRSRDVTLGRAPIGFDQGDVDLPDVEERIVTAKFALAPGEPRLACVTPGAGGIAVFVRVVPATPRRDVAPPRGADDRVFALLDVGAFLDPPEVELGCFGPMRAGDTDPVVASDEYSYGDSYDRIEAEVHAAMGEGLETEVVIHRFGEMLAFVGSRAGHDRARAFLEAEAARRLPVYEVRIERLALRPAAAAALLAALEGEAALAPDWEESLEGAGGDRVRAEVLGFAGRWLELRGARLRSFVVDSEQVSGGTGFSIVERSDPVVASAGDGIDWSVRIEPSVDEGFVTLRIHGIETAITTVRQCDARFPMVAVARGTAASDSGGAAAAAAGAGGAVGVEAIKAVALSLPQQSVARWNEQRAVPLGRDVLLALETARDGRVHALIARVAKADGS